MWKHGDILEFFLANKLRHFARLCNMAARFRSYVVIFAPKINILQRFTRCTQTSSGRNVDESLLEIVVCPLSKEPLR